MANLASTRPAPSLPQPAAVVQLLKPVTWFPPMWAFACGAVSSGVSLSDHWGLVLAGMALSGPLVCGTSQAVNDWFDRHVDAINEPGRPIPSGRIPGRWGLFIAVIWTVLSLAVALALGPVVFWAAGFGMAMAWAYSAPPFRLKGNGWWGNAAVGLCYEGLPWFTGAAVLLSAVPGWAILVLALLYSAGAHGIMTLNDFKAIAGDTRMGVRSLPVQLGVAGAARVACAVMALPQVAVIGLLVVWGRPLHAAAVSVLLLVQLVMMRRFLAEPVQRALWYSGFGVPLYVSGMMVSAFALRGLA
ncbi:chlorophyll synthase ChlG [Aestuariivirga litoralis]|uniref:Chlorophyll synthase ChlG n=1 Tax=Aestuariivirga litoralis TaxID=2650924 RepID=A0A2W2BIR1_9HYPH|nr:chlorophyll synthase ChlG [Aestuariivirga litoralis]PZF76069.1 chlorophyll synthase ChlG [Aestuariivirga litoralis]